MIREFKEEIERLRKLLAEKDSGGGGSALMASMLSGMLSAQSAAAEETGPSVRASDLVPERPKEQPPRHDYASPVKRTIQEVWHREISGMILLLLMNGIMAL
jgi:hypothetical protein